MDKYSNSLRSALKIRLPKTTAYFNLIVEGKTLEVLHISSVRII